MATLYVCDRCGTFHTEPLEKINIPTRKYGETQGVFLLEICNDCLDKLHEWMKNLSIIYKVSPDPILDQPISATRTTEENDIIPLDPIKDDEIPF